MKKLKKVNENKEVEIPEVPIEPKRESTLIDTENQYKSTEPVMLAPNLL